MTIHLSILILAAAADDAGGDGAALGGSAVALVGSLVPLGYAVIMLVDYEPGPGSSTSPTTRGSRTSGSATRWGSTD